MHALSRRRSGTLRGGMERQKGNMKSLASPRRLIILAIVLIVGIVVYFQQTKPDLQPLGSRARQALTFGSVETHTWWLNEKELLLLRNAAPGGAAFARYDIDTHAETPLPELTALYRQSNGKIETLRPSPAGDWLLWTGNQNSTYVTTLDGKRHYQVPETSRRLNVWNFNGDGWYGLNLSGDTVSQATERNLDNPLQIARSTAIAYQFPNDPNATNLDHVVSKSPTQLIVPLWPKGKGKLNKANIILTGFGPSPTSISPLIMPAPYLNDGGALAFSPMSGQIAWQLDILLPAARFWRDMGIPASSRYCVAFFVTNQAGENLSYGYLDADKNDSASRPTDLQISPGGTYFSFVLRKALWIVHT